MEREQALRALEMVGDARRRVRRHSVNNGVIPLVWGAVVLLCLPLFDFLAPPSAAAILGTVAVVTSVWTGVYARRMRIQPERAAAREYLALMLGWGVYYAVVLLIVMPFVLLGRVGSPATLLVGGGWMLARGRR